MELGCKELGLIQETKARALETIELVGVVLEPVVESVALHLLAKAKLPPKISKGGSNRDGAVSLFPHVQSQPGSGGPVGAKCFAFWGGKFWHQCLGKIDG